MEIKAIETRYNGYKFRSRVEARWAVFMDTLGVKYEYEKEGFDLGEFGYYLPDFWLPEHQCWVEIKGAEPTSKEQGLCHELAQAVKNDVVLLFGQPYPDEFTVYIYRPGFLSLDHYTEITKCRRCDGLCGLRDNDEDSAWADFGKHTCGDHDKFPMSAKSGMAPELTAAYAAARQARFEHRETPTAVRQ